MPIKTTRGVVISEKDFNDSDKLITIFSEEGKFKGIVNGAKNPKSSLAAGSRLFAWTEFQYYPGKNFAKISQAHLIDSFYNISTDLKAISLVSYISDLVNQFFDDNQIDKIVLKHLVYILFYINKDLKKAELLTLAFQIKLLIALGIIPNIHGILKLDRSKSVYFNINDGDFYNHYTDSKSFQYKISPKEIELILDLYKSPIKAINNIDINNLDKDNILRLIEIFNHYIENQLSYRLKSFKILKEIINLEF